MGAGQYKSESTRGSNSITNKNPGPRPVKDKITDSRQLKYSSSRDDVDCVGALEKGRVCKSRQDLRPTDQEVDCGLYCWWTEYYSKRLDDVVRMCSEEMQPGSAGCGPNYGNRGYGKRTMCDIASKKQSEGAGGIPSYNTCEQCIIRKMSAGYSDIETDFWVALCLAESCVSPLRECCNCGTQQVAGLVLTGPKV